MSVAIEHQRVKTEQLAVLEFAEPVAASLLGISGFKGSWSTNKTQAVRLFAVALKESATVGRRLFVTPSLRLWDTGNPVAHADSWVDMTAISWHGANASKGVVFAMRDDIPKPPSSLPIGLPGEQLAVAASVLRGFHLEHTDGWHEVKTLNVQTGQSISTNRANAHLNIIAEFFDADNHSAQRKTVSAGFIGCAASTQVDARVIQINDGDEPTVTFDRAVKQAGVFLTGFEITRSEGAQQFGSITVSASLKAPPDGASNTVQLEGAVRLEKAGVKPTTGTATVLVLAVH